MTNEAFWWWLIELCIGLFVIANAGRGLESFITLVTPRRWRERQLPTPPDSDSVIIGTVIGVLVASAVAFFSVAALARPLNPLSLVLVTALALAVSCGGWVLSHVRSWWLLESGCPLRATLDSLVHKTGIPVGRVRLRDSQGKVPRVFLDGSLELSTTFVAGTPPEEQAFLLAAALHQRQEKSPKKLLLTWLAVFAGYLLVIVLEAEIRHLITGRASDNLLIANALLFPAIFFMSLRARYSTRTLQFALLHTGDVDAAASAVQSVDKWNGERQAEELRTWWDEQQASPTLPTQFPSVPSTPVQQQPLRRKP